MQGVQFFMQPNFISLSGNQFTLMPAQNFRRIFKAHQRRHEVVNGECQPKDTCHEQAVFGEYLGQSGKVLIAKTRIIQQIRHCRNKQQAPKDHCDPHGLLEHLILGEAPDGVPYNYADPGKDD
ncbi:MAG: hypothetical protein RH946_06070 [Rhodospirillales bacterium]